MRKLGFGLIAASALLMSGVSTTPARADATAAILIGTVVVATVACQPGVAVPAGQVLCLFSPFTWIGTAQAAPSSKGTIKVKSAKKSKSKKG